VRLGREGGDWRGRIIRPRDALFFFETNRGEQGVYPCIICRSTRTITYVAQTRMSTANGPRVSAPRIIALWRRDRRVGGAVMAGGSLATALPWSCDAGDRGDAGGAYENTGADPMRGCTAGSEFALLLKYSTLMATVGKASLPSPVPAK